MKYALSYYDLNPKNGLEENLEPIASFQPIKNWIKKLLARIEENRIERKIVKLIKNRFRNK